MTESILAVVVIAVLLGIAVAFSAYSRQIERFISPKTSFVVSAIAVTGLMTFFIIDLVKEFRLFNLFLVLIGGAGWLLDLYKKYIALRSHRGKP